MLNKNKNNKIQNKTKKVKIAYAQFLDSSANCNWKLEKCAQQLGVIVWWCDDNHEERS